MHIHPRAERRLLALILALFVLLGSSYALITPAFEASDELWHFPMVRHLADGNPLPVQVFDPALAGPWNQEASQPPLYYYLAAALTFWIDTADMEQVRWLNPHVDNGVITPDGNINLVIHDPTADPWAGTLLAIRIVRLFSVLLGAATVYLTYRIAAEIAPGRPAVALLAAAFNAFLPMLLFISGAVNNDNLAVPLASLALLLMIRIVTRRAGGYYPVRWTVWAAVGVVLGLAALTKEGTLGLFPLAFGTAVVSAWQRAAGEEQRNAEKRGGKTRRDAEEAIPNSSSAFLRAPLRFSASLFSSLALVALPAAAIAGWWYYRNIVLYGDWLGWSAFIAVLGQRATPASLVQLWGERRGFMMSFWGLFGGVNVPMAGWVYAVLNGFLVLTVVGFAVYFIRLLVGEWRAVRGGASENAPSAGGGVAGGGWRVASGDQRPTTSDLPRAESASEDADGHGGEAAHLRMRTPRGDGAARESWFGRLLRWLQPLLGVVERNFGLIVIMLFAAAVVYGLVQWATTTWSSQGRLVFTAISALCVLMALGWGALLDLRGRRTGVRERPVRSALMAAPALFLFAVAAAAPWLWIRPAYVPPAYPGPLATQVDIDFGGDMRLVGYELQSGETRPGDTVRVRLAWEALRPMARDWSVFVHLNDPVLGRPIAQRDMFPGQGLLATRLLSPGERLVNEYVLSVPATAVAPAALELVVGLYDYGTGERLMAEATAGGRPPTADGAQTTDAVLLATVPLSPRVGEFPNPVSIFFEHGLELVGFAVEPRRVAAGGELAAVTYWRPTEPLPADFTFFAQVVGADTTRYAAVDAAPPAPTSGWQPGQVYEVRLPLTIDPATPPEAYPLIVGLYTRTAEGGFDRLQLVTPDGRLTEDFLTLTLVRVEP